MEEDNLIAVISNSVKLVERDIVQILDVFTGKGIEKEKLKKN